MLHWHRKTTTSPLMLPHLGMQHMQQCAAEHITFMLPALLLRWAYHYTYSDALQVKPYWLLVHTRCRGSAAKDPVYKSEGATCRCSICT